MKILVAPDSFKECLDAYSVAESIKKGILRARPDSEVIGFPLSDGGDGSFDIITRYLDAEIREVFCFDPLMREISAPLAFSGSRAIIEMARASGLGLLSDHEKDALVTDSYGTGQLIMNAIEEGVEEIVLCLGGTATMDAGHGILRAMGFFFRDRNGNQLMPGSISLSELDQIEIPENLELLQKTSFIVFSDVVNPLCGENGAARVFAPQKGAGETEVGQIEKSIEHFALKISELTNFDISAFPGGGAAGGVAAGLKAFFDVRLESGAEKIIEMSGFDDHLPDADLVITAEGRLDSQTSSGKLPGVISERCRKSGKKVIFIGGQVPGEISGNEGEMFDAVFSISPGPVSLSDSILNASKYLERTAYNIGKLLT